ncbi:carbohydrate ABC transporter permease [Natrarchaeobius sp. A-rgal3]|uniref:carbohydrate ABC transporter permease n=1 Tax=Natrarchaeobius versutus TaxID=1679078 RepID=UPI0035108F31
MAVKERYADLVTWSIYNPNDVYRVLMAVGIAFFLLMALFPFYWLFVLALTPQENLSNIYLFPDGFNPGVFVEVFQEVPFHIYMFNSIVIATITTVVVVFIGSLAGYVFGRMEFPGRVPVFFGILIVSYFPAVAFFLPLFLLFTENISVLGITPPAVFNSPGGVIFPMSAFLMPLIVFLLATFYSQIPDGLEDAARVEGSTRIGALFRVIMPVSAPAVATSAVLGFIIVYNEFFFSYLMFDGQPGSGAPIVHGIFRYQGQFEVSYHLMAAASIVGVIPMAVVVLIAQEKIVSGLTQGAVKE